MTDFALQPEVEALRSSAERLARRELEPRVRDNEAAGCWPDEVLSVLAGFPLGGLDLAESLGGVEAGALAKVVVLETIGAADAGGLPAADQPGRATGALLACPDTALAAELAGACLAGDAQCALVVLDPEEPEPRRVEWCPSWPPLRWAFVSRGDDLELVEIPPDTRLEPTKSLAFQASGGGSLALDGLAERGRWHLPAGAGPTLRGRARLWAAAIAVGIAQAALDETIEYTLDRVVFGKPVAHHQGNAFDLAAAAAGVHGARLVVRDAATAFDRDEEYAGFWATQAWSETMDAAFNATNLGIQLLGGHGFLVDHLAEKRFREARMLTLLGGGRDAAALDLAAQVLDVPDPLFSSDLEVRDVIRFDERTREMLDEVRELGRQYMRPIGLESDRTAEPPPVEHPFYLICARQGGLVSRQIGEGEAEAREARRSPGSRCATSSSARRAPTGTGASPCRCPAPAWAARPCAAPAPPSSASGSSRSSPTTPRPAGGPWP